jgi:predicted enzyme related to lactoylglutathione lyase
MSNLPPLAVWFELPAVDFERAVTFYEAALKVSLRREEMLSSKLAIFPHEKPGIGGCVVFGEGYRPNLDGAVIYLNSPDKLEAALARIEAAGGKVVCPPVALPSGAARFAHFIDSEGNRVGLADKG